MHRIKAVSSSVVLLLGMGVLGACGEDLAPDHARFTAHCKRLLEQGCDGIALLGTTGEANSFSVAERMWLLEGVVEGGIPAERLLPGITADLPPFAKPGSSAWPRFSARRKESSASGPPWRPRAAPSPC